MKSLKQKIILLMLASGLSIIIILLSITVFSINRYSSQLMRLNENTVNSDYDMNIRNQVENTVSLVDAVHRYQQSRGLSDSQGKEIARELIRTIRYNESGYFWIDDFDGVNVLLPPTPKAEGKSRINLKDVKGKELIKEILAKGKQEKGGFTDYWFPKPGEKEASLKRGYSKSFAPYRWVIGTGNYIDDIRELIKNQYSANDEYIKKLLTVLMLASLVLTIIMIFVSILFGKSIADPVIASSVVSQNLSKGDLTSRIDRKYSTRKDEVGIMAASMNNAMANIEKMVSSVVESLKNLYQSIEQINQGNQNLSQRTSEQASALEEIASTLEETSATVSQNTDNSKHANETSMASSDFAEKGGILVNSAVESINEISASSKRIGEIISVIDEIAFQTNLLALNAAVEAARAGEQGRGFAVVAGEVRNLAGRSASAAKEIGELIRDSLSKIEHGTDQANMSGDAIQEIIASVKNVTGLIAEISMSSEEQKTGMGQINSAVMELDSMTQQNAALVEEIASSSEEMASQAQEILDLTDMCRISDKGTELNRTDVKKPVMKEDEPPSRQMEDQGYEEF